MPLPSPLWRGAGGEGGDNLVGKLATRTRRELTLILTPLREGEGNVWSLP